MDIPLWTRHGSRAEVTWCVVRNLNGGYHRLMIIYQSANEGASAHGPAAYVGYTSGSRGLSLPYESSTFFLFIFWTLIVHAINLCDRIEKSKLLSRWQPRELGDGRQVTDDREAVSVGHALFLTKSECTELGGSSFLAFVPYFSFFTFFSSRALSSFSYHSLSSSPGVTQILLPASRSILFCVPVATPRIVSCSPSLSPNFP
jgi:hypothetical protein